ncbi:hypothetical protein [Phormidium sp. CCY1219]|uniref:hypothetical protein n=1 Tax=Phormidium sp. CCY1219 TaxID=2886104 RepID=UPI002D1F0A4B|nr:hypothetical protein [Phormidium sp. CCY1219]MEB3827125.1 hypothetical protein [Phormidium sp. CCY1219]
MPLYLSEYLPSEARGIEGYPRPLPAKKKRSPPRDRQITEFSYTQMYYCCLKTASTVLLREFLSPLRPAIVTSETLMGAHRTRGGGSATAEAWGTFSV